MSDTNYQPVPSGEGAPPPAYAPQAQQPVNIIPSQQPQRVAATSGGLPQQYAAPAQQQPYAYAQPVPSQPQQPIIVQPVQDYQTTTIIVAKSGQQGGYPAQQRGTGANNNNGNGPPEEYQDLLCVSCLVCFFCAWPCGIFALIYSSNAQTAHTRGDYNEYRRQNTSARRCIRLSIITGIICLALVVAMNA